MNQKANRNTVIEVLKFLKDSFQGLRYTIQKNELIPGVSRLQEASSLHIGADLRVMIEGIPEHVKIFTAIITSFATYGQMIADGHKSDQRIAKLLANIDVLTVDLLKEYSVISDHHHSFKF